MRKIRRFALLVVAVVALLLLTGCARSITGTYRNRAWAYTVILNDDSTGSFSKHGTTFKGTYTVNGDEIILRCPTLWDVATFHFTIDKDTLTCEDGLSLQKEK